MSTAPQPAKPSAKPKPTIVSKGDRVWVPHEEHCYLPCTVKESKDGKIVCFDDQYKQYNFASNEVILFLRLLLIFSFLILSFLLI